MAQADNIGPVMLKSGEYVVRKEAVDELGKDTMDMINNADRLGYMGGGLVPQGQHGHSAIDELLALNTLDVQRNTDMTRQSSMMQRGGQIKPVMSKEESNYSLGVVDELAKALASFEEMAPLMQIKSSKDRREALSDAQDSGMIMSNEDALEALMKIADSYNKNRLDSTKMKGLQSFQNGGYGSMGTQGYQEQYGSFLEDDEERAEFERLFGKPDVSRFLQDRDMLQSQARDRLRELQQQTAGSLFQGDSMASRGITRDFENRIQQSLTDTLMREEEDALRYLSEAESTGADFTQANPYQQALSSPNAPVNPGTVFGETAIGTDGQTYTWNGNNWFISQGTGGFGGATGVGGGG